MGAVMSSNAQKDATRTNRKNVKDTNKANLWLNMISRGLPITDEMASSLGLSADMVGSSSAVLPYYMKGIEKELSAIATSTSQSIRDASPTAEGLQEILGRYSEGFSAADTLANDISSGRVTQQMLDEQEPVGQARMDVAAGKKNAALEALRSTLNEIDAIQAKKGYSGDSFGNRMLKFNARRGIANQWASDIGGAKLQNALDKAALQEQGRTLRIGNIGLSDRLARASVDRATIPGKTLAEQSKTSMAPFEFFNLGPHNFSAQQTPPTVAPVAGAGQLIAQAGAGVGNTALNYYLNQQLQTQQANQARNNAEWLKLSNTNVGGGAGAPAGDYGAGSADWAAGLA